MCMSKNVGKERGGQLSFEMSEIPIDIREDTQISTEIPTTYVG